MSDIPDYVRNNLPSPNVSINEFLAIFLPPCTSVTVRLMRVEKYLSEQPPNIHNVNNVSELLPPPAEVVLALKRRLRDQNGSITSVICPHLPTSGGARYPLWIIEFWAELSMVCDIQENWKRAASQLEAKFRAAPKNHLLQCVVKTLAHLPWTGNILGYRNTIDLCELWVYFTQELVFEGPVLGPAKDRDWTEPGPERTGKLKDHKRPDRVKTAKDRCEPDRLRPVETGLW